MHPPIVSYFSQNCFFTSSSWMIFRFPFQLHLRYPTMVSFCICTNSFGHHYQNINNDAPKNGNSKSLGHRQTNNNGLKLLNFDLFIIITVWFVLTIFINKSLKKFTLIVVTEMKKCSKNSRLYTLESINQSPSPFCKI